MRSQAGARERIWTLSVLFVFAFILSLGQLASAQETKPDTKPDTKPASSLTGSLKIVKLLWKSNPKSAATTLAKSLAVALERDQQSELAESLAH